VDVIHEVEPGLPVSASPLYVMDLAAEVAYDWQQRRDLLFVGGFNHPPNLDGLGWFVDEVMPLVWQACPELKLHVVGSNAPQAVQALAGERVIIHGYLSDEQLAAQYASARTVVVPLRFGAGVKGKVLEAVQFGVPLVTSSIGAEGLPLAEEIFNVADSAEDFSAAIVALERGDAVRLARRDRYHNYLCDYFSKARASDILYRDFGSPDIERGGLA